MTLYFRTLFLILCCCSMLHAQESEPDLEHLFNGIEPPERLVKHGHDKPNQEISQLDITLSAECEPLTTVADCVNLISGHFFQIDKDLQGSTIDPVNLTRYYDSGNRGESFMGFGFGCQFPLLASDIQEGARHSHGLISEREGFLLPYQGTEFQAQHPCLIDPRLLKKGYTNLARAMGGTRSNFVNRKALFRAHPAADQGYWTVMLGDGSKRLYKKKVKLEEEAGERLHFPTKAAYLLTEEVKPNGNLTRFSYEQINGKPLLSHIQTINRSRNAVLNQWSFKHSKEGCQVTSSCGKQCYYTYKQALYIPPFSKAIYRPILKQCLSNQNGESRYFTDSDNKNIPKIIRVEKPGNRFVAIDYHQGKVNLLQEPLGTNGETITTYKFYYADRHTLVLNALQHLTIYHFDQNQRLSQMTYHNGSSVKNEIVRQDVFEWSQEKGEEGWLKSKSICLGDFVFHLKAFQYDDRGNVIKETVYGNLTGEKSGTFTLDQKKQTDSYSLTYRYSQDGRNLLLSKETPEGLSIQYEYEPDTNLCTKELIHYEGKLQERKFTFYDENAQVRMTVEDDGSSQNSEDLTGITFRRMTTIMAETKGSAAFGKPKEIVDWCLHPSNGQMSVLKTTHLYYDVNGNEINRRVYNAQNALAYETATAYDDKQRIIQQVDPVGNSTFYTYDESNNKTEERFCSPDAILQFVIHYQYDLGNRLVCKKESHLSGQIFTTRYEYDALNHLIAQIDSHGNRTTFVYDRLGREIEQIKPSMQHANGQVVVPKISKTYNVLNQAITQTDENGCTTRYTYNSYGSPTQITYPDQSVERFIYYPSGWLKQKWETDGTSSRFTYDGKGHLIKETVLDASGGILKEEEWTYHGAHLLYKKDAMGVVTHYQYDGAGRKTAEIVNEQKATFYEYDEFDRIIKQTRPIGNGRYQIETYEYDSLNRMTAKTLLDDQGRLYSKENYAYDPQGNQIQKACWRSTEETAVYLSKYDSDGSLLQRENPLGEAMTWFHAHEHINALNQRVHTRAIHDALKRPTIEEDDACGRLIQKTIHDDSGCVSRESCSYDAKGQLVKKTHTVMSQGNPLRDYTLLSDYDSRGRLLSQSEMPAGKTTQYVYDLKGRLIKKTKPDEVSIAYEYDSLGRLQSQTSSDRTIDYRYRFDLHDNPVEVYDAVHNLSVKRKYDLLKRLVEEELAPGIVLHYSYDGLDRVIQLTLPDGSFIRYTYDAWYLKSAERCNPFGKVLYRYDCSAYNGAGQLLKGLSPAGATDYTYDLLGRAVAIQANEWSSQQTRFDPVGNLLAMNQSDPNGEVQEQFAYDRFNHLTYEKEQGNRFDYDSLGNCLQHNEKNAVVNDLNQVISEGSAAYTYDANGNLLTQSHPQAVYTYDALNRLSTCIKEGVKTTFLYDAFGRCLQFLDNEGVHFLLYQGDKEIGSWLNGKLHDFRLVHPYASQEAVFAIELKQQVFFPLQDFRHHICALQKEDGALAQWVRYSAFGKEELFGETMSPWRFANRRAIAGLLLFTHRFYNPELRRWQTTDPLGFEDGMNLYRYVHNNPFYYRDPDGQFAFVIPLVTAVFGPGGLAAISGPTIGAIIGSVVGFTAGWAVYEINKNYDEAHEVEDTDTRTKNNTDAGNRKKTPVRTEPNNLEEQLALEEAKANPESKEIMQGKINDPNYPASDWKKCAHAHEDANGNNIEVHFWENRHTGEREGFKFKD